MWIAAHGKVREIGQRRAASFPLDFSRIRRPADHLRGFDVEQVRCMQRMSTIEKQQFHRS